MQLQFILPVTPTAQARPRVAVRGKFARAYKTADQKANERTLEAWLKDYAPKKPLEGPVRLEFVAYLPIPRSVHKRVREAMLAGEEYPVKRPDIDNLCKQILDACTRLQFWHDDSQVVSLWCHKYYAEVGKWDVRIRVVELGV